MQHDFFLLFFWLKRKISAKELINKKKKGVQQLFESVNCSWRYEASTKPCTCWVLHSVMCCTVIKHSRHLRTLEHCSKHPPVARVFYISLVFSDARRAIWQCNALLRLLYFLNIFISFQAGTVTNSTIWLVLSAVRIFLSLTTVTVTLARVFPWVLFFSFESLEKINKLFTGLGSVRIVKNCDRGLCKSSFQIMFTIRTSQPAENMYFFLNPSFWCMTWRDVAQKGCAE